MIGPTGVGKTEIARRLARLADAPFLKVEASKFTEVGYVGRDVESIVRDLTEIAVADGARGEDARNPRPREGRTEQRLLELLLPRACPTTRSRPSETRNKLRTMLREGKLEDAVRGSRGRRQDASPPSRSSTNQGVEEMDINVKEMLPGLFGSKKKRRKATVAEAREILQAEEEGRLVDPAVVAREAVERAQSSGIVFLDEIDKVAGRESAPRARRLARGRSAGPSADRRRHYREHQVRARQDRPRALHRRGRIPRLEALGSDPGAAGPVSDPRRARVADDGRLRPDPDRAGERALEAVPRASGRREGGPAVLG